MCGDHDPGLQPCHHCVPVFSKRRLRSEGEEGCVQEVDDPVGINVFLFGRLHATKSLSLVVVGLVRRAHQQQRQDPV